MVLIILLPNLFIQKKKLIEIHEETKHLDTPIYIGLMPLTSSKNAEFLHHEVPGIKIADPIRDSLAALNNDPVKSAQEGINITKSLIDTAAELFNGIYLITPFLRYEMTVELSEYARSTTDRLRRNHLV